MDDRVRLTKYKNGDYCLASRVTRSAVSVPQALVAQLMRPGKDILMDIFGAYYSLAHAHDAVVRKTAKQLGIRLMGHFAFCDGCAAGRASAVPSPCSRASRPLQRVFGDQTGPILYSAGRLTYSLRLVYDFTNIGRSVFRRTSRRLTSLTLSGVSWSPSRISLLFMVNRRPFARTTGPSLTTWSLTLVAGGAWCYYTREWTPRDGSKRNGKAEQRIALIHEGGIAAFLEFPVHSPDLVLSALAGDLDVVDV